MVKDLHRMVLGLGGSTAQIQVELVCPPLSIEWKLSQVSGILIDSMSLLLSYTRCGALFSSYTACASFIFVISCVGDLWFHSSTCSLRIQTQTDLRRDDVSFVKCFPNPLGRFCR